MPRKNIKFNDKEKTRRFARNTRVIKEIERLIKVEKGIKININKTNKFPKEYADQLTKKEFFDAYRRANSKIPGLKKKGSVRTVSGGSTGLLQQKVKKW